MAIVSLLAASALVVLAAGFVVARAHGATPARTTSATSIATVSTMAPVVADYRYRNAMIADLESDVRGNPNQLDTRMLAGQYLQRFREAPDVGDLLRAVAEAHLALRYQPRFNAAADSTLASAYNALHQFRLAKQYAEDVVRISPWSDDARAGDASMNMELGNYADARKLLSMSPGRTNAAWRTVAARYAELTGNLSAAREIIARARVEADSNTYLPAENRAWYHWREGEMAFEAGDLAAAESKYKEALIMFPHYWHATAGLAKLYWAEKRWHESLAEATASVDVYPLPETLGYEYDAQLALHDKVAAHVTARLIAAIERIGNAQRINDRLIAVFYSDHGIALGRAVTIARRDLSVRHDIYAEDTLAWALAMHGQWKAAREYAEDAGGLGTQDARLQFHTAVIELHNGERARALRRLRYALSLNAHFHPLYADQARRILQQ